MSFQTIEQAEAAVGAAKALYHDVVASELQALGTIRAVAEKIGMQEGTVRGIINRGKFGPMRRLARRIKGMCDPE